MQPTTPTSLLFPKPSTDDLFERWCLILFRAHFGGTNWDRFQGRGRPQHGIDILGRDGDNRFVAIQCKMRNAGSPLTMDEIKADVKKAKKLDSSPAVLIFATTDESKKLQQAVLKYSKRRQAAGAFPVEIKYWGDLCDLLNEHPGILPELLPAAPAADATSDMPAPVPRWKSGLVVALAAMVVTGGVIWIPWWPARALLAVGTLAFSLWLWYSPERRFWRLGCLTIGASISVASIPTMRTVLSLGPDQFGFLDIESSSLSGIVLAVVGFGLMYLDWRREQAARDLARRAAPPTGGDASASPSEEDPGHQYVMRIPVETLRDADAVDGLCRLTAQARADRIRIEAVFYRNESTI